MSQSNTPLPSDVLAALQRGDKLDAIKKLRAASGVALKEAKEAIDQHLSGEPVSVVATTPHGALPRDVEEAMRGGRKIEAIRLLRAQTGLGLAEAKEAVERIPRAAHGAEGESCANERSGPGGFIWAVALAVVGLVLYFVLG